ncbi:MAG: methyltransferase domain-containing protein [Alphaproteobacteria bacterium]
MTQFHRSAATLPTLFLAPLVALSLGTASVAAARDVPYVPTPQEAVTKMLQMADVQPDDLVYDLGSGDGRIVITAVRDFGVKRAIGIDIDPQRIDESYENARKAGVTDRVEFKEANIFEEDFSEADVITMYLLSTVNLRLRPRLLDELRPGTRLVSHQFTMDDWKPDAQATAAGRPLYFWVVPAKVEGGWKVDGQEVSMDLEQRFQVVTGTVTAFGQPAEIENGRLEGEKLTFQAKGTRDGKPVTLAFDGRVSGENAMEGTLTVDGSGSDVKATRGQ